MDSFIFILGTSLIILHEMDAIRYHEWRIFPGLALLNDRWGFMLFMVAHVPLSVWVIASLSNPTFRTGFSIFLLVHLGLHLLFLKHPKNEFKDWISWFIIIGAAICGGLTLFIYQ